MSVADDPERTAREAPATPVGHPLDPRALSRAVARALDGVVLIVGETGDLDFVSDDAAELIGPDLAFEELWHWLGPRFEELLDREVLLRDGETSADVRLPEELGGRVLFARFFPVEGEDCAGYLAVLKDRRSLDALHADLRRAAQMRRIASLFEQGAHDLKAPLNALAITVDVARGKLADEGADDLVEEDLGVLRRETFRLKRMIQKLMSQAGWQATTTPRRFELRRLVRECVALVRVQAKHAGVTVRTELGDATAQVLGVRDELRHAFVNLLTNAVEAMPDGGALTIRLHPREDAVELAISDTGVGVPPGRIERVFKLHVTTKPEGSGVGLFSARATLRAMGGDVTLESVEGRGTTARATLPLAPPGGRKRVSWSKR